ncbi:MAG: hypothetical protein K6T83_12215 [Alicyclobacillus sp.]|nr:hypothetical protein [Alicyclobacillus sp.]
MAAYIAATKSESDAKKARRFFEKNGVPCWIAMNKTTFVLFTIDEAAVQRAKQLRHWPFRPYRHRHRRSR